MASMKLVVIGLVALGAVVQARHGGDRDGGNRDGGNFDGMRDHNGGDRWGWDHGQNGTRPCMKPNADWLTSCMGLDNATADSVVLLWANYIDGSNCSDIQAQQDEMIKAAMEARMDAKAATLNDPVKAVYDQIKALSDDDKRALMEFFQGLKDFGGHDCGRESGWGGDSDERDGDDRSDSDEDEGRNGRHH